MSALLEAVRAAYDLVPRAVTGGALAGAACGAVGVLLRWRRLVWAGFAVPQAAIVGGAAALGAASLWTSLGGALDALPAVLRGSEDALGWISNGDLLTLLAAAAAVLWLVPIGRRTGKGGERAAAACFLLATTLVVLLVSQSPHGTEELKEAAVGRTLLFLSPEDARLLGFAMPAVAAAALALAPSIASVAFDRDHARATGRAVARTEALFAVVFLALCAILAPRTGAAFLFAYVTLPAAAAERLVARPIPTVLVAGALGALGSLAGATAAVRYDLPFATASTAGILGLAALATAVGALGRLARR